MSETVEAGTTAGPGIDRGFRHDVLYAADAGHLVDAVAGQLVEGLSTGEAGLLVCTDPVKEKVLARLGGDVRVRALDRGSRHVNATLALAGLRAAVREELESGAPAVRGVGEAAFGDDPADWTEWTRYEALNNLAFAGLPVRITCAFGSHLPRPVLAAAEATHPGVLAGATSSPNPRYVDPAELLTRYARTAPDPVEATAPALEVSGRPRLGALRQAVRDALTGAGVPAPAVDDVVVSVNEVASNVDRHGSPPMALRLWTTPERVVVTVTDHGAGPGDVTAGYLPPAAARMVTGGMGLWLTRQLCDRVDLVASGGTFTVRLTKRLPIPR